MAKQKHLRILTSAQYNRGPNFWNQWRKQKSRPPDLIGAKILGSLQGFNLSGTYMLDCQLPETNLADTDLSGAHLARANLQGANLSRADLSGADLTGANLKEANLTGVTLERAFMYGTVFKDTVFADTNLSEAVNLYAAKHRGPSCIDYRTIANSNDLPIEFLRGCGLSDYEIRVANFYRGDLPTTELTEIAYELIHMHMDSVIRYYSCFISYSHDDRAFASYLHDALQQRGVRCWLDEHQIYPGDDIRDKIDQGISLWDKILLCCSESSLNS